MQERIVIDDPGYKWDHLLREQQLEKFQEWLLESYFNEPPGPFAEALDNGTLPVALVKACGID